MIAIGLATDEAGIAAWLTEVGASPDQVSVIRFGLFGAEDIEHWIGMEPPPKGTKHVELVAPDPIEGERPRWLEFEPFACWTSDLIAVRVRGDRPGPASD